MSYDIMSLFTSGQANRTDMIDWERSASVFKNTNSNWKFSLDERLKEAGLNGGYS